jgi:hypothetical protein
MCTQSIILILTKLQPRKVRAKRGEASSYKNIKLSRHTKQQPSPFDFVAVVMMEGIAITNNPLYSGIPITYNESDFL